MNAAARRGSNPWFRTARGRQSGHQPPTSWITPRMAFGLAIIAIFTVCALAAGWVAPGGPLSYTAVPLATPNWEHWLGANDVGQDNLVQLLYGARISLLVGLTAATLSTAVAWLIGLGSGFSRFADGLAGGTADLMLAIPALPLVILIAAYLGAGLPVVIITLGLVSWGPFARVIRGQVQSELQKPYIEAARAVGSTRLKIILRHVAPATVPTAVAKFVMTVQYAIVAQASLGFLGLGDPTVVSWGQMVHQAALSPLIYLDSSWSWRLLPPALAIGLLVSGVALIGWSIEERSLPRSARR